MSRRRFSKKNSPYNYIKYHSNLKDVVGDSHIFFFIHFHDVPNALFCLLIIFKRTSENQMAKSDNIFLVGPMGVGKTTIGKKLARKLKKKFFDSDKEIEKKTGATINLIFDVEGEQGFRERESKMIEELTSIDGIVMATGGGAVLSVSNRRVLSKRGTVIYLSGSPDLLMTRTAYDQNRPLLNTSDRLKKIKLLLKEREPLYSEVADMCLNVDNMTINGIVNSISTFLDERCEK